MDETNGNEGLRLPLAKIRAIAKMDETQLSVKRNTFVTDLRTSLFPLIVHLQISGEALFTLAKTTELFMEYLTRVSAEKMAKRKRKNLGKADIEEAIAEHDNLMFLEDLIDMDNHEILSLPKP